MATAPPDDPTDGPTLVVPPPPYGPTLVIEDDKAKPADTTLGTPIAALVTSIGTGKAAPEEKHEQKAEGGQKRVQPIVGTEHWVKPVHTGDPFKDWLLDILGFGINLIAHSAKRLGSIALRLVALPFVLVAAPFSAKARQFIVDTPRAVLNNVGSFFKNFDDAVLGMPAKVLLNKDELLEQRKRDKAETEAKRAQEENPAMKKKLEDVDANSAAQKRTGPLNKDGTDLLHPLAVTPDGHDAMDPPHHDDATATRDVPTPTAPVEPDDAVPDDPHAPTAPDADDADDAHTGPDL